MNQSSNRSGLFIGVDRATFSAAFADALRRAGVPASVTAITRASAALGHVEVSDRSELYWALRVALVSRRDDIDVFDAVFDAVFDKQRPLRERTINVHVESSSDDEHVRLPTDSDAAAEADGLPWATLPSVSTFDAEFDAVDELTLPELAPTSVAAMAERPFDQLDEAEIDAVSTLLAQRVARWPTRRTRRHRSARSGGRVAPRATMRRAMRRGGEALTIERQRPRRRERRVVAFIDVSGSMEAYARAYLHLLRPLVVAGRAEVFAFATEPHRITAALRARSTAEVVRRLDDMIPDRFSGTRIAASLATIYRQRTWSNALRGSVVLVLSDGWETESADDLARVMQRISRIAKRVVWVNPRVAGRDFQPTVAGMAAALPSCDVLVSGHNAASVGAVFDAITAS